MWVYPRLIDKLSRSTWCFEGGGGLWAGKDLKRKIQSPLPTLEWISCTWYPPIQCLQPAASDPPYGLPSPAITVTALEQFCVVIGHRPIDSVFCVFLFAGSIRAGLPSGALLVRHFSLWGDLNACKSGLDPCLHPDIMDRVSWLPSWLPYSIFFASIWFSQHFQARSSHL